MYSVSAEYIEQLKSPVHRYRITGTIGQRSFGDGNILQGSLSITNQASSGDDLVVGSVYIGCLRMTLLDIPVTEKMQISIYEGLKVGDTYEDVPIGVYTVDEATQTDYGIDIVAYDNMSKFDKKFAFNTVTGKPYELLTMLCTNCGVPLGMTQEEVQALTNGNQTLVLMTESDVDTYRDVLFWLAQTCASFATVNRNGSLILRGYTQTADDTVTDYNRFSGCRFSKFETRYSGLSCVDIATKQTKYYAMPDDRYLTYNLGSNPFLQQADKDTLRRNVLLGLQGIKYVPFDATVHAGAVYDLGDVIEFSGGIADDTKLSCVTGFEYSYKNGVRLSGVGKDPAKVNASSKVDKNLAGIMNSIEAEKMQYYMFTNAHDVTVADASTETIIDIRFVVLKTATVIFHAEIKLEAETTNTGINYTDALATVSYIINENEELYHPQETWVDGKHILHLLYYMSIPDAEMRHFQARLNMAGGNVTINAGDIHASIYGQGLAATEEWNGNLDFETSVAGIPMQDVTVASFGGDFSIVAHTPYLETFSDAVGGVQMQEITLGGITDTLTAFLTHRGQINATDALPIYDPTEVDIVDDAFVIIGTAPQSLTRVLIDVDYPVASIRDVQMTLTNCTFRFRGDSGDNWKVWNSNVQEWRDGVTGMVANDVVALTPAQWLALVDNGYLEAEIIMTDANSTVEEFSLEYTEEVTENEGTD